MASLSHEQDGWQKVWSKTHKREYWFNTSTGDKSWIDPMNTTTTSAINETDTTGVDCHSKKRPLELSEDENSRNVTLSSSSKSRVVDIVETQTRQAIYDAIEAERLSHAVNDPDFPRYISTVDTHSLAAKLRKEYATKLYDNPKFKVLFSLPGHN